MGRDLISTVSIRTFRTAHFVLEVSRLQAGGGLIEMAGIAIFLSRQYASAKNVDLTTSALPM
ncbi:hypothetical protein GCM10007874_62490 [Labrys miyagiensis]|uniref:Uncharacterized protein n=1 Tax=Labrys miyagiensis TaxID=346912 RepID=A0ABQ6CSV7_9HYPH|nr:hypothetical protein [Labrys miyagiensis]GLS23229.1 hypothetical protein GCM10007874_62490 [Labrys miyagiensis]